MRHTSHNNKMKKSKKKIDDFEALFKTSMKRINIQAINNIKTLSNYYYANLTLGTFPGSVLKFAKNNQKPMKPFTNEFFHLFFFLVEKKSE